MRLPIRKSVKLLIVLLLIALFNLHGCGSETTKSNETNESDATTGNITGIVAASSNIAFKASRTAFQDTFSGATGVPGAVCTVEGTDINTAADEHGFFTITDVVPGTYIIICRKTASNGKVFAFFKTAEVQAGKTTDIGLVQITQTGTVRGKTTLSGQGIHSGISVYIPGISMHVLTDASGAYLINDIPEGTYDLLSEMEGYIAASQQIIVASGETTIVSDTTLPAVPIVEPTYEPIVNPNITVTIAQPSQGSAVSTPLLIAATVNSLYELKDVRARLNGVETDLSFSNNAVCSKKWSWSCSPGWSGSISLTGLERGEHLLIVKAADVFGNITEAARSFIFDQKPILSAAEPLDETVARPQVHISATCTDDDPAGCISIKVTVNNTVISTGQSSIDETVSLSSFDGKKITIAFEAKDSANQVTTVGRTLYVESSNILTEVEKVGGSIYDVLPERILFFDKSVSDPALKIRNRVTDEDTRIPVISGKEPQYGFLTPGGAIFVARDNDYRLFEWSDNAFAEIDFPYNNNLVRGGNSLKVSGNYAIWNMERILSFRDLMTGANTTVSDNTGGWGLADVAANGDVVYSSYCGGFDCNIFRFRQGTVTRLTDDLGGPTIGYSFHNSKPLTDGINVVYSKKSPPSIGNTYAIVMYGISGEENILAPARSLEPSPGSDYQLNNGWIAFTRPGSDDKLQVWLRSPSGQETKLTFWGTSSRIGALSPDGEVTFVNGNRTYLGGPGLTAIEIGSSLGRSFWQNGQWHVTIGRSLFNIVR